MYIDVDQDLPGTPGQFFNPGINAFPPAFPLPTHLNPFHEDGVSIYPVPLYSHAVPHLKTFVAKTMLDEAKAEGRLEGVHTLVEASSGNTANALGLLSPYYGIRRVRAVVEWDTAPGKLEQLRLAGVTHQNNEPGCTTIQTARELGRQKGWLNLCQYSNPANWRAHCSFTGPHVWAATDGKLTVFCAALGTTGTVVGVDRFLNEMSAQTVVVGIACAPGHAVPGVRTIEKLREIEFDWRGAIESSEEVTTHEAYKMSLALYRTGLMAGPSSGLAFAGLLQFLLRAKNGKTLDSLRNKEGRIVAAFICGDTAFPYPEKYSMALDGKDFEPLTLDVE